MNACCVSAAPPGAGGTALKLHVFQLGLSQPATINKGGNEHVTAYGLLLPSCSAVNACCVSAAPPEGGTAAHNCKLNALQSGMSQPTTKNKFRHGHVTASCSRQAGFAVNACCVSADPPEGGNAAPKLHAFQPGLSQPTAIHKSRHGHVTASCSRQAVLL